jgi:fatty-acid peroxygenase
MRDIPREQAPESTLALLQDPYRFIARRCDEQGSDIFEARLLLRRTLCMRGERAARLFYDPDRFSRADAAPELLRNTLFGNGGVQTLDGEQHRRRKAMFVALLMTPANVDRLTHLVRGLWQGAAAEWTTDGGPVVLYDAARTLLARAVCTWAGVPLEQADVARRTDQLTALFQHAGKASPLHLLARLARQQLQQWVAGLIRRVRDGELDAPPGSALAVVAEYREQDGQPLSGHDAAVELLNVLRPTVAIAVFVVHAAVALHRHPECRLRIAAGDDAYAALFVEEVRRFYPFFPAVVAQVREAFDWEGFHFPVGQRVLLDLHGTNRDSRSWGDAEAFRPERFATRAANPFDFVPQGGGDPALHHRCPGELITVELMKVAVTFLTRAIRYEVPAQDLEPDTSELPALPRSGFVLERVQLMQ